MAVAADLPQLENRTEFKPSQNSVLVDVRGKYLATLSDQGRIIVPTKDIALSMQHAIIAIEDERFYENDGVDLRGIGRALFQDLSSRRASQGGSTITQQFVKNATQAQSRRTVLEKIREAALAYHLTRKWSKQKILTEYLNSIYFGNGAYGIESAARTYFGRDVDHLGCGKPQDRCASELMPHEAALLAGMVASPNGFDPIVNRGGRDETAQRRAGEDARAGLPDARRVRARHPGAGALARHDPPAAGAGGEQVRGVLRDLGAPAGDRPLRRARGAARRAARADDARPRHAAPRRGCDQEVARRSADGPAGGARRDQQHDRRGARDGRRERLRPGPLQPRHTGPAPAGLGVQAVRSRDRAAQRDLAELDVGLQAPGDQGAGQHREVHRK